MSLIEEQCKKVCRILDDVLANRPTERDSLIVATRSAFSALSGPHWIPVTERFIKEEKTYWYCCMDAAPRTIQGDEQMKPSAQSKKGRWIRHNTYHGDDTSGYVDPDWRCSKCGKNAMVNEWMLYDLSNFCPNCGADMREVTT